ncbi:MAG: TetR/AcrR family transcriptional regulator [Microbacter sp.]
MEQNTESHDTERRILEAAERLFLEKGFALTSTTEIAKEASCNQALVHYYFRTKEHLFEAIFEQKVYLFMTTFLEIDSSNDSFEEKLRKKIEAHFDILNANPKLPFLFVNELTTNPERIEIVKEKLGYTTQAFYHRFVQELQAEITKGTIRPIDPVDLLLTIISLNAVLFLVSPVMKIITNISDEQMQALINQRKAENVKIIINSLKP